MIYYTLTQKLKHPNQKITLPDVIVLDVKYTGREVMFLLGNPETKQAFKMASLEDVMSNYEIINDSIQGN